MTNDTEIIVNIINNTEMHHFVFEGETVDGVKLVAIGKYQSSVADGDIVNIYDGDGNVISFDTNSVVEVDKQRDVYFKGGTMVSFI